jgi:hypothetical protein
MTPHLKPDQSIPTTLEAVLDHEWLAESLSDVADDERVVAVEQIDSTKTLAQKVRFRATVESSDIGNWVRFSASVGQRPFSRP